MSYVKTQWVNNTTPINDTNLNKIEQGIYDNSLVVDAIKNTINPTDTETYKTAELTEGQITDVIGVNDIVIKGNTSQDGEPTPSSPIDVNVVSGNNVIRTNNKNLLPNNAQNLTQNGVTFTVNKDKSIKINGTASANTDIYLFGGTTDRGNYLHFSKGTYSLSTPDSKFYYIAREKTKGALIGNSAILQALASDDCYFYGFFIRANQNSVFNNFVINPQLEKGSTATTYETHQGKELPLDLGSIELCKIGDYQDYFYKSENNWYLHKEIEKMILGDYNWTLANNTSISNINTNRWYTAHSCSKLPNNNAKVIMSNILPMGTANSTYGQDALLIGQSATQLIIRMPVEYTTASEIKTALQNLSAYAYVLKNEAANTEITDTTLISQLEAIYNAPLYEETNITQTNNDLPMILDITACKDNINGIKAFIRK